ncbi:interferon-induced protein with tetratricopeptide repeats 1-like [Synchiropus picturatus]
MTESLLTCRCLPSSATESQTNMEARLKSLQCHFTWDELTEETKPGTVKETLENIGIDEGNYWLPHIYNLQGYLHHRLGSDEEALQFLHQATEDFHCRYGPEEGPWLMVNYGNLAWLLHLTGQQSESERYLSLSENLMGGVLHPEVAAEKAWTLMALVSNHLKTVEELFLAAIERKPERVEWKTSLVFALVRAEKHESSLKEDTWQRLYRARQEDPENLCIAMKLLYHRAKQEEDVADEARNLAQEVLRSPVSSYSGLKQMLRLYSYFLSRDEAVKLAEDALIEHPDEHYLKWCAALCYYWKITDKKGDLVPPSMMDRAICLHQDVIALYPGTCLVKLIHLANIHACRDQRRADQMYSDLFAQFPDPAHQQMLCNHYGRLWNKRRDYGKALYYNKKAAMMEPQGFYRDNSMKYLKRCAARDRKLASDIEEFLNHLPRVDP